MKKEEKEKKYIYIRYCANPDWPDNISHKDTRLHKLIKHRTVKFELDQYEEAWKFIMECSSPITKLSHVLWAFPRKKALDILKAMDELKSDVPDFIYEELEDNNISNEDIENTLRNMKINEKSYSELILIE